MSNSNRKILPVLIVGITAACTIQPVFGGAVHQFVLTENLSTSLMVTYDGSSITPQFVSPDRWTFLLPTDFVNTSVGGGQAWTEPDNSNLVNLVTFGTDITRGAFVTSDLTSDRLAGTGISPIADGATVQVGTAGGVPVFATFTDNAATSETAPETGMTCSLLGFSLVSLAFLRRKL